MKDWQMLLIVIALGTIGSAFVGLLFEVFR